MLLNYLLAALGLIVLAYAGFRFVVRRDYLKKGKLSFISYMLELILFALHANFMYLFIPVKWPDLPSFPENIYLNILCRVLLYGGLLIVFVAIAGLGFGPTMGQDKKSLRKTGLYKFSRNPQVIGYFMFLMAFALCYPSLYAVGWLILFVIMIGFMIQTEEEFLLKAYGEEYRQYCRDVPRLIGPF